MRNSPRSRFQLFGTVPQLFVVICIEGVAAAAATSPPILISKSTSTRALAFESVTQKSEPFNLTAAVPFSPDKRTRIAMFAMNLDLLLGESANALSADAEDAAHNHYPLNVEYVGQVP